MELPYGSAQEGAAILSWQKDQRVELLKTIAVVTASVNPDRAQRALTLLIEEMFPAQKIEREKAVDKALEIMETEQRRVYAVRKTNSKKSALGRKIGNILSRRRRR